MKLMVNVGLYALNLIIAGCSFVNEKYLNKFLCYGQKENKQIDSAEKILKTLMPY